MLADIQVESGLTLADANDPYTVQDKYALADIQVEVGLTKHD